MVFSEGFVAGVDALGSVLLHFLWQGAVLGLFYALLRPFCASVGARYRLGMGVLLMLAMCPVVTLLYIWPAQGDALVAAKQVLPKIVTGTIAAVADTAASSYRWRSLLPAFVGVWSLGVVALASRSLWHWRRIARLVRRAAMPLPEWEQRLKVMCGRFGLLRPVRLLASAGVATPMLVGWIKPVILLPLGMLSGFSTHQIELIIAHELGHVRRWDYLANLFQVVLETVLFYHPVVHWISRDVRDARESCCDDLVLSLAKGNPVAYARALADLEELRHDIDVVAPALGASGGVLLARIKRIVAVDSHDPLPRNNAWPVLLVVAAMVCFALRPQQHASDLGAALAKAPAQGLALVTGNPRLAPAAAAPAAALPAVEQHAEPVLPAVAPAPMPNEAAVEPVRIDLPRADKVALPAAAAQQIRNLASRALPTEAPSFEAASLSPQLPNLLRKVAPAYPAHAMAARVEGIVELEYAIGGDGSVRDVRVLRAQPEGVFDAAAKAALGQWLFETPSAENAGARYVQNFEFTLHGKPASPDNGKCQQVLGSLICRHFDE
ncbi:MAG TPA: TonB family protein [Rudaea sp.]|nr:TonB family protein [Rudaea sp.]